MIVVILRISFHQKKFQFGKPIEFSAIDVNKTVGVGSTSQLFLFEKTNPDVAPENVIEGYRIGARENDQLKILVSSGEELVEYGAKIIMPGSNSSSDKSFNVSRSLVGINSIGRYSQSGADNVITLTEPHTFINGESVRVYGDTGQIPDGLSPNIVYYVITDQIHQVVCLPLQISNLQKP